jgi:thioredoxin 1
MSQELKLRDLIAVSKKPVLIEFFTKWSGAHHIVSASLREIQRNYSSRVVFRMIDAEAHRDIAMAYGVQTIPTILIFFNNQIVDHFIGLTSGSAIVDKLDALLDSSQSRSP